MDEWLLNAICNCFMILILLLIIIAIGAVIIFAVGGVASMIYSLIEDYNTRSR